MEAQAKDNLAIARIAEANAKKAKEDAKIAEANARAAEAEVKKAKEERGILNDQHAHDEKMKKLEVDKKNQEMEEQKSKQAHEMQMQEREQAFQIEKLRLQLKLQESKENSTLRAEQMRLDHEETKNLAKVTQEAAEKVTASYTETAKHAMQAVATVASPYPRRRLEPESPVVAPQLLLAPHSTPHTGSSLVGPPQSAPTPSATATDHSGRSRGGSATQTFSTSGRFTPTAGVANASFSGFGGGSATQTFNTSGRFTPSGQQETAGVANANATPPSNTSFSNNSNLGSFTVPGTSSFGTSFQSATPAFANGGGSFQNAPSFAPSSNSAFGRKRPAGRGDQTLQENPNVINGARQSNKRMKR